MRALRDRAKPNTLTRFERAATRRYAEAVLLKGAEPLGAVYLFGYTCEIRLKAAYYRLTALPPHHDIDQRIPPAPIAPRPQAEARIRNLLTGYTGAPPGPVGHHLQGWALAVEDARAASLVGPFDHAFAVELFDQVNKMWRIWTESLRYCPFKPYNTEMEDAAAAARWFKLHYRQLWS